MLPARQRAIQQHWPEARTQDAAYDGPLPLEQLPNVFAARAAGSDAIPLVCGPRLDLIRHIPFETNHFESSRTIELPRLDAAKLIGA
jgi:hypothetical protein